uniref:Folate receptor-like domain-containing protein n=1 Tax=Latimeria chalumnae TaxID=7897 RepID=H3AUG3_LATCH
MLKFIAVVLFVLVPLAVGHHSCLEGKLHKHHPSPEPDTKECKLYANCKVYSYNPTRQLTSWVTIEVMDSGLVKSGPVGSTCQAYMKKVECFYQCSTLSEHWMNPKDKSSILNTPICKSFCDDWFAACQNDMTCTQNWLTDWSWTDAGNFCKRSCIPYHQMYENGSHMCETMWGDSFKVSKSTCRCIQMTKRDEAVLEYILGSGPNEEQSCQQKVKEMGLLK